MKLNRHIRKMLFVGLWCIIGGGVMVLLVAAIRNRKDKTCAGYEISMAGGNGQWFMNKKEVVDILTDKGTVALKGRSLKRFDLRAMEERLQKNVWIRDAELFFDNNQVLQVKIAERDPIARIFTAMGNSFYIDSSCERLPLSDKVSAKLPVFTGFPSEKARVGKADSLLLHHIKQVSLFIQHDPFWMAQIAQTDIQPDRKFEMIPMVGNHVIEFGDGTDFDKKFARLLQFYRLVLSKTGMDVYDRLNVQYDRQVIGVKKGTYVARVDSVQAARSAQALIASAQKAMADTASRQQEARSQEMLSSVNNSPAKSSATTEKPPIPVSTALKRTSNSPKNSPVKDRSYETLKKPVKKVAPPAKKAPPPSKKPTPKAVMPKKKT
ncbi:cell division protein FtsQ/DivIB [Paraflavitalea soli]|nr:cell division protein FtsQ/DivIB [Paraflavitalea soli]